MAKAEILQALKELDLNEKESETYLALLELGQNNVTRISQRTGINRVTTYSILNSLSKKGMIITTEKDKIQNFLAIEPKKILALIKQKEKKIESILPELESIKGVVTEKTSTSVYEGKRGIVELLQDVLDNAKTVYVYGNREVAEKIIEFESLNFRKERIRRGIKLIGVSNILEEFIAKDKSWRKHSEFRLVKECEKLSTWTFIYGTKIAVLSFKKELVGIITDNEEIAQTHKFFFDMLWDKGKKV